MNAEAQIVILGHWAYKNLNVPPEHWSHEDYLALSILYADTLTRVLDNQSFFINDSSK